MNRARILLYLARADFLERIRQYSFLFVLAATTYLGYSFYRGDVYLELDGYRGLMNSAWAGGMMATSTSLVLSLFGFYLVKNSIERDMRTGVGQIIATTRIPTHRFPVMESYFREAYTTELIGEILAPEALVKNRHLLWGIDP